MAVCLKKINGMKGIRLVDAGFIWTEPHSKKLKVRITIQKEVDSGAKLEQTLVIDYDEVNQTCDICTKNVSNMTWIALVQLRQKVAHKRTFMMIEQLILKHGAHRHATSIVSSPDGMDFYFSSRSHARTFLDFAESISPTHVKFSRQLVSHDSHSNSFNYKYTFLATIIPLVSIIILYHKNNLNLFLVSHYTHKLLLFISVKMIYLYFLKEPLLVWVCLKFV